MELALEIGIMLTDLKTILDSAEDVAVKLRSALGVINTSISNVEVKDKESVIKLSILYMFKSEFLRTCMENWGDDMLKAMTTD